MRGAVYVPGALLGPQHTGCFSGEASCASQTLSTIQLSTSSGSRSSLQPYTAAKRGWQK